MSKYEDSTPPLRFVETKLLGAMFVCVCSGEENVIEYQRFKAESNSGHARARCRVAYCEKCNVVHIYVHASEADDAVFDSENRALKQSVADLTEELGKLRTNIAMGHQNELADVRASLDLENAAKCRAQEELTWYRNELRRRAPNLVASHEFNNPRRRYLKLPPFNDEE